MAGILDYGRSTKQRGGLLDWFQDDPESIQGPAASGRAPLTGQQKQSLIFSGISDAIDSLQGREGDMTEQMSNRYAQDYTKQNAERRKSAVNKAIQDAYGTGNMGAVRSALLNADPADVAHITQALQFGAPQDVAYAPGQTIFAKDPLTGNLTEKQKIPEKQTPNQPFNPDGTANKAYQDYQVMLRQQGRDAGLGADALFSMVDTGQGAFGVTRGGAVKPMMGPDGKPLISYHSDPQTRFDTSAAGSAGKAAGTAAEAFPTVKANFGLINDTLKGFEDPAVKSQAGKSVGYGGYLPTVPGINSDFRARQGQLEGQAFLQAFNTLRGGGQITEVEGAKATNAITRLQKAQTPTEFYTALHDARGIFQNLYESARQRASRGAIVPALQGGGVNQPAGAQADPLGIRK